MKRKILGIFGILLVVMSISTNVYAKRVTEAGDKVVQEGTYDSVRFVAGNTVVDKATVDGISFVAGNDVTLEGNTPYGFYAGNMVLVNENIEKDIFVAGNKITLDSNAIIGRDAYIAGNSVVIKTNIARDLRLGSDSVDLSGVTIGGNAYIMADNIILDANTNIVGKFTYPEDANIRGLDSANVGSIKTVENRAVEVEINFVDSAVEFIFSVCAAFIVMIVLFYLLPKTKDKLNEEKTNFESILKNIGIGLLVLIVVPIIALFGLFTSVLTPLALIVGAIYIISIYLSSLLSYYVIGNIVNKKLIKKDNTYLTLLIGILGVKLIKLIPFIGPFVGAICLFYGMGLIFLYVKNR